MYQLALYVAEEIPLTICRWVLGDEKTAEILFGLPFDAGFCRRHSRELGELLAIYLQAQCTEAVEP